MRFYCISLTFSFFLIKTLKYAFSPYLITMAGIKSFLKEERAQSEWSSVYMLVILIIAALLLITVIKPMFRQSQQIVKRVVPTV